MPRKSKRSRRSKKSKKSKRKSRRYRSAKPIDDLKVVETILKECKAKDVNIQNYFNSIKENLLKNGVFANKDMEKELEESNNFNDMLSALLVYDIYDTKDQRNS